MFDLFLLTLVMITEPFYWRLQTFGDDYWALLLEDTNVWWWQISLAIGGNKRWWWQISLAIGGHKRWWWLLSLAIGWYKRWLWLLSLAIGGYKRWWWLLKGQSHEIFCTRFFHQSVHSGPTRDVQWPFKFFLPIG